MDLEFEELPQLFAVSKAPPTKKKRPVIHLTENVDADPVLCLCGHQIAARDLYATYLVGTCRLCQRAEHSDKRMHRLLD